MHTNALSGFQSRLITVDDFTPKGDDHSSLRCKPGLHGVRRYVPAVGDTLQEPREFFHDFDTDTALRNMAQRSGNLHIPLVGIPILLCCLHIVKTARGRGRECSLMEHTEQLTTVTSSLPSSFWASRRASIDYLGPISAHTFFIGQLRQHACGYTLVFRDPPAFDVHAH